MRRRSHLWLRLGLTMAAGAFVLLLRPNLWRTAAHAQARDDRKFTTDERVAQFGEAVDQRLRPHFEAAGVAYPPPALVLLGLKHEQRLELYGPGADGELVYIHAYPILAASGGPGPKLREGDYQVPEGFYRLSAFNPNSLYHLSLRLNYPNADDRRRGAADGRDNLGGDIMIHGRAASIGCLAMGDPTAEDLFVLAARTGLDNIEVILSPLDMRPLNAPPRPPATAPAWTPQLWRSLHQRLNELPSPPPILSTPAPPPALAP